MKKIQWTSDPSHSEVTFKVRHLMITGITGQFMHFDIDVETDGPDFDKIYNLRFRCAVSSLDTGNEDRDRHLRSGDFFDAANFPEILFENTTDPDSLQKGRINGKLTIKDRTRPLTVDVNFGGIVEDSFGQTKAGFTLSGVISRKEYGITWNGRMESGGAVVSDQVRFDCEIQLIKGKDSEFA